MIERTFSLALTTEHPRGFPDGAVAKNPPATAGGRRDAGSIPGSGGRPGVGNSNPFRYHCLENAHGQRSLVGCSPWGCKESDTTEQRSTAQAIVNSMEINPDNSTEDKQRLYIQFAVASVD